MLFTSSPDFGFLVSPSLIRMHEAEKSLREMTNLVVR